MLVPYRLDPTRHSNIIVKPVTPNNVGVYNFFATMNPINYLNTLVKNVYETTATIVNDNDPLSYLTEKFDEIMTATIDKIVRNVLCQL